MKQTQRPPNGVIPERLWLEQRLDNLLKAVIEYHKEGFTIPAVWFEELAKHQRALNEETK